MLAFLNYFQCDNEKWFPRFNVHFLLSGEYEHFS